MIKLEYHVCIILRPYIKNRQEDRERNLPFVPDVCLD